MRDYAAMAKAAGFTGAAVLPVRELVVVPEYRRFCAQNLCGNYGVLPACPPMSGTVEEMTADMRRYQTALILMIETTPVDYWDTAEQKAAKKHQNLLTEQLMEQMRADGLTDLLMMGAGLSRDDWHENAPHLSAERCARHAAALHTRLLITHLNPKYDPAALLAEAQNVHPDTFAAHIGTTYSV